MSYLKTSQTKHVETKTQKVSTPPKYLQSNLSSKGVRSTSYVHRTFVDAEAKVEPDDPRFSGMTSNALKTLLKALGVNKPTGKKKENWQQEISDLLGKDFDETQLPAFKKTRLKAIYKFVSGKIFDYGNLTDEEIVAELTNLISLEINGRPATKINNFMNQTSTDQTPIVKKKTTPTAPTKEEKVKLVMPGAVGANPIVDSVKKGMKKVKINQTFYTFNKGVTKMYKKLSVKKSELVFDSSKTSTAPTAATKTAPVVKKPPAAATKTTAQTEDEKQKTKFNEFWEIVKDMNKKDINNKITSLKKSQKDVKNMLTELQKLLDRSGPYVPSFKARGDFLAGVADKNSNKTLTADEIRKIIQGNQKLKELFRIGKTGEFNENMEPFVSWGISRTTIDTDKNGKYTLEEFAQYYLAAVLKKKGRDQLTGEYYKPDTFDTMLKLFGIGDEKEEDENDGETKRDSGEPKQDLGKNKDAHPNADTEPGTQVLYNGSPYTLRDLNKDETKWSLTYREDGKDKRFARGRGFKFEEISLIPPPVKKVSPPKQPVKPPPVKPPPPKPTITDKKVPPSKSPIVPPPAPQTKVVPPPAPQTTSPTLKVGDIVKNLSTEGRNVNSVGIITEMKKEKADVTWQDGNQTNNKKLTDLQLVTIDPATEKKIKKIFNYYDTKRKDGNLDNGESLKFLRENLKRISQVFSKKELFSQPDGKSGISFEEFRFMLTVIPDTIAKFEEREAKSKSKGPAPPVQRTIQEDPVKAQRIRQPDPEKAKQEFSDREKQAREQDRQAALDRQEQARQAALDRQKETEQAVLENQKRKKEEKTKIIADDKKIIVELNNKGEYVVRPTKAYTDYKKKLVDIPETTCKPENNNK
jgi:hypothetical protein